jgi:hypothetical protein
MKQPIVINQNNVVKDAVRFSEKSDLHTSMSKAVELEILRKRMMSGEVVRFLYLKADGITLKSTAELCKPILWHLTLKERDCLSVYTDNSLISQQCLWAGGHSRLRTSSA